MHIFPMGICAMWKANSTVKDLNSCHRVYILRRCPLHQQCFAENLTCWESHLYTRALSHTHSHARAHTHTHTLKLSLSLSLSLTHTLSLSHTHSLYLSFHLSYYFFLSLTFSLALCLCFSFFSFRFFFLQEKRNLFTYFLLSYILAASFIYQVKFQIVHLSYSPFVHEEMTRKKYSHELITENALLM